MTSISQQLLDWYKTQKRDLPWRQTRDPYNILVSEVMLQQTQVSRVLDYYDRWIETFPDWATLANASNADVIELWAGLGYNRRALMLRDAACDVVKNGVPENRKEWLRLKGVGPYTSAAVALFSQKEAVLPIDTNVRRVLGRILFGDPFPQPDEDERLREIEGELLDQSLPYQDLPQAIFDLASSTCGKKPACSTCPMRQQCKAAKTFIQEEVEIPKRMNPKAQETKHRNKPYPDRIYRGRILKLVRENAPVDPHAVGPHIDPDFKRKKDDVWVRAMIGRLEKDGLVKVVAGELELPE